MNPPHILASRIPALAFVLSSLAASVTAEGATVAAQWNFNDLLNVGSSVSNVGGFVGTFNGVADRTAAGGGVSGLAGDYALDRGALGNSGDGAMVSSTPEFLSALNAATGTQAFSITYWQFLNSTPNSTGFWGNSPSAFGGRGLNAHSPWGDGNTYFDTSGCCAGGTQRTSGFLGATTGVWELMAFTFDNGTRTIYRRELTAGSTVQIAQTTGGVPLLTDHDAFYIGNDNFILDKGMDARLDNFTVWTGALSQTEIDALPVPEPGCTVLAAVGAVLGLARRPRRQS